MQTIQVNGREVEYRISQGKSRKYVTLKFLSEHELEIVVPKERTVDVETLLKKKALLIRKKHSEFLANQKILNGQQESGQRDQLLLFGKFYEVGINKNGEYAISLDDNRIEICLPKSAKTKGLEYEFLRKWIKKELLKTLNEYLRVYERKMGAPINKLYIKSQKTRLASYSPKRNIHFNIKLAALPRKIIEYVIIHELSHTIQPNHNRKFWHIVKRFCPNYKKRKQELKGYSLLIQENRIWQRMLKD